MSYYFKTPENLAKAREMRKLGHTFKEIAARIGCNHKTIGNWFDINLKHTDAIRNLAKRVKRAAAGGRPQHCNRLYLRIAVDADARMKEIPADTRNISQQLTGEPLPGRSALDQRKHNQPKTISLGTAANFQEEQEWSNSSPAI